MVRNSCQTTKDVGLNIGKSMQEVFTKYAKVNPPLRVKYKNWKGEVSIRNIIPQEVWFGHTDYHKDKQWLLNVWDIEKDAPRTYAMMDIIEFIKK